MYIYVHLSVFLFFLLCWFAVTNEISIKSPLLMASVPFLTRVRLSRNKQKGRVRAVGQRAENSEWFPRVHRRTLESEDAILLSSTVPLSLSLSLRRKKKERGKKRKKEKGEKGKKIRKHSLFIRGLKLRGDSARYFATAFKRSSPYYHRDGPRGRKRLRVSDIKRLMCNS